MPDDALRRRRVRQDRFASEKGAPPIHVGVTAHGRLSSRGQTCPFSTAVPGRRHPCHRPLCCWKWPVACRMGLPGQAKWPPGRARRSLAAAGPEFNW